MGSYRLSGQAASDIDVIARVSLKDWGSDKARAYIQALHATLGLLARFPDLGRDLSVLRPGILRMPTGSHSIFYRKQESGVFIVRVLHQRMDFSRHL